MHSEQLEVLNISNINANGVIVLNDEKLLECIQKYPFLYNKDMVQHNDPDYAEWAWKRIATALNNSYENNPTDEQIFPAPVLIERWRLLQPIILSLSKSYDINAIPCNFRKHVVNLSNHLEKEKSDAKPQIYNRAQNIILENIAMVERLPLELRKQLEGEMMSILLANELEKKSTYVANAQEVELEVTNILQDIGFKYKTNSLNGRKKAKATKATMPSMVTIPLPNIGADKATMPPAVVHKDLVHTPFVDSKDDMLVVDVGDQSEESQRGSKCDEMMEDLLVPLDRPQWIPLEQAAFYVRNCVVRVKRMQLILPDDLSVKRIKKEKCFLMD